MKGSDMPEEHFPFQVGFAGRLLGVMIEKIHITRLQPYYF
jgi:hypothetical protein